MPSSETSAASEAKQRILAALSDFRPDESTGQDLRVQQAVFLARKLQRRATELQMPQERRQQAELDRMLQTPSDKVTLMQLTDQAFRSHRPHRAADQLIHILDVQGIPRFFTPLDRTLLAGFQSFGGYLPGVTVPLVKDKMQRETANVVLPAEREMLAEHLRQRRDAHVRMNVNFLGEALLGENEAKVRLNRYLQALQYPEIEVISVKISTLDSQISPLAREHTITRLVDRMELLYRAAAKQTFTRADGSETPNFVYLDMEEYRDMHLTAEVFMRTLDRPGLEQATAGIVLQAYIPDSHLVQQRLTQWAQQRVASGGTPITLRIVKGANMEMERVEASLFGWSQAPFQHKIQTDANYRHMLHYGMQPENRAAVRLGIASHNIFELAYALVLGANDDGLDEMQFEMLEGMANHQRRALFELTGNLLLYAPACRHEDFINAIGYLIRRLDENTGEENFLRHAFHLEVDSPTWTHLQQTFVDAFAEIPKLCDAPRRQQDRRLPPDRLASDADFANEPDTDFALPHNGEWAAELVQRWLAQQDAAAAKVPLVIAGEEVWNDSTMRDSFNPSSPEKVVARFTQASTDDVERAVATAKADPDGWRQLTCPERSEILAKAAQFFRERRGDLIGAAMIDGGKTIPETDPEVSEAVDFVEYYSRCAQYFEDLEGVDVSPCGVVAVISPWNFPLAIPCGGVAAALAAGNCVILKPASDTVLIASEMCKCFWDAGVSRNALQFVPCPGRPEGQQLAAHDDVDVVVLTGGTSTARAMLKACPTMRLLAETGGKNATVVTALADRDQAIKHVIHSAFGHNGQKCSATSLLILEAEIYDDPDFKRALCDAIESLPIGPAHDLATRIGPLIRKPDGDLNRALKELEQGESWAVMPQRAEECDNLYSPGVKWDVAPGSYTHLTEFFGPVLAVMRAKDLADAVQLANQTGFGLTSGLESLDDREQDFWQQHIRAGNLYINRSTTGAIVTRQPFGGMGKSAFGPGIKAGGPNYVSQFMQIRDSEQPADASDLIDDSLDVLLSEVAINDDTVSVVRRAAASYADWFAREFATPQDHVRLLGQDNFCRYLPVAQLRIRIHADDTIEETLCRIAAARTVGCSFSVSYPADLSEGLMGQLDELTRDWAASIEFIEESDEELARAMRLRQTSRLRYAHPSRVPAIVRQIAPQVELFVADEPICQHGRIELLWYLQGQSLSIDYHRYGNLGARGDEERSEVL